METDRSTEVAWASCACGIVSFAVRPENRGLLIRATCPRCGTDAVSFSTGAEDHLGRDED